MFLIQDDTFFVSLRFLLLMFLLLLLLGIYMRGLRKIVDGYYKSKESGMISFNAFLSELLACLAMPLYVFADAVDDIVFMWRK